MRLIALLAFDRCFHLDGGDAACMFLQYASSTAVAFPSWVLAVALTVLLTSMEVSWSDVLIRSRSLRPLISTEFSPSMAATFRFASPSTLEASNAKSKSESASKFRDDPLLTEPSTASTPRQRTADLH